MDLRGAWLLANLCTVALTGAVCGLLLIMLDDARRKLNIAGQAEDARAWLRHDIAYLRDKLAVNGAVCIMGLLLIAVALDWQGAVYAFVPLGTAGFALIWALNAWTEYRAWWRLHEVAELSARLAGMGRRDREGAIPD
jgi:hypothetical protein